MLVSSFDEREVEILVLALRYWRSQRGDGRTRRTDASLTASDIDVLLAKLGFVSLSAAPPDDYSTPASSR
jgi:hypothetical protein